MRGARQLLTLRGRSGARRGSSLGNLEVIEDGSLLIRNGIIEQVGSTRRLENLIETRVATEVAVNGAVVMPGFVDASIAAHASVAPSGRLNASAFFDRCSSLLRSCLQHGTLHAQLRVDAPGGDLRPSFSALRQVTTLGGHNRSLTRCWRVEHLHPVHDLVEAIPTIAQRKLAHRLEFQIASVDSSLKSLWAAAHAAKLGVNLVYPGAHLEQLRTGANVGRPRMVICDGALQEDECSILSEMGAPVVTAPPRCMTKDIYEGTLRRLVQHGCALAIASGYDENESPVANMQIAISLAVFRLGLSVEEAIAAATANAAHAAGVAHITGTLEVGKRADFLVLDLSDYRELPRQFGTNHVLLAFREGKPVVNRTGHKLLLV